MKKTIQNRVAIGLCSEPWCVKACFDCQRNRANLPPDSWSATPDIRPSPSGGHCTYYLGAPVRKQA